MTIIRVLVMIAFLGMVASPALGQGINNIDSYIHTPIDSVDVNSGNLVLHIPLLSYKQLGTLPDFTLELGYNNKSWQAVTYPEYGGVSIQECEAEGAIYTGPCSYTIFVYSGVGVQVVRGNTFTFGSMSYPDPLTEWSTDPTDEYVNTVANDSGVQSILYGPPGQQLNPSLTMTVDGTGIVCAGACRDTRRVAHGANPDPIPYGVGFTDYWRDPSGNTVQPVMPVTGNTWDIVTNWIDSVGRNIPAPLIGPPYTSTYPTGCRKYQFPVTDTVGGTYQFCFTSYNIMSAFHDPDVGDGSATIVMLSSVGLPDGSQYQFSYNSWGDLSGILLPEGGTISYQWGSATVSENTPCNPICNEQDRVLQSRTLDAHDGTPVKTWTYAIANGGGYVTDPVGNDTFYSEDQYGTTTEAHYQGPASGGQVLETISNCRTQQNGWVYYFAPELPQPTIGCGTTITLPSGLVSHVSYTYDPPRTLGDPWNQEDTGTASYSLGIPLSKTETGFGSGSAGSVVRTTTTQYEWQINSNYFEYVDLPASVTVTDGSGNQLSQTKYGYDENNGSPQGVYGNQTSVHSWLNTTGTTINSSTIYNGQGMPTQNIDGNGNITAITGYQCSGLFPKTVVAAYGSTTTLPETTTYGYDCTLGKVTSVMDPNSQTTDYAYNDPLGRVTQIKQAVGTSVESWTSYTYPSLTEIDIAQDKSTKGDGALKSSYFYNALKEQIMSVGPNGAITATKYDQKGRVATVSNPYFSTSDATYGITQYSYDALDRKILQTQADGSSTLQWCYDGIVVSSFQTICSKNASSIANTSWVDSADETGRHWQQVSDGLGRLVAAMEPDPVTNIPSLETDYTYDALNNLWNVNQKGASGSTAHTRSFSYDSLSRLVTSTNPETGTICYGQWNSGKCANGYDANGNLQYKTDNRNITLGYSYDALNRLLSKTYLNDPFGTASSCYQYDTSSVPGTGGNLVGRLTNSWTQKGSCPSQPALNSSATLTRRSMLSYDPMGRLLSEQQCTFANCKTAAPYNPTYDYDLAGNVIHHSNGIGTLTFTNCYNGAGQLSLVFGVSTSCSSPTGLTLFSAPSYTAAGGLSAATYGTGLNLTRTYDSRLRITGETDTGNSATNPTPGTATITITGTDQTH